MRRYALTMSMIAAGLTIGLAVPRAYAEAPPRRTDDVLADRGEVPSDPAAAEVVLATLPASSPSPPAADANRGSTQRTVGWVLGGAGLVGIGAALMVGLQARSTMNDAYANCTTLDGEKRCSASSSDQLDKVHAQALAADVLLGLGVASLATGAIVYFTSPSPAPERRTASIGVAPAIAPGAAGLVAVGRF